MSESYALETDPVGLASSINLVINDLQYTTSITADMLQPWTHSRTIPWIETAFEAMMLALLDFPTLTLILQEASHNCLNAPFAPPKSAQHAVQQSAHLMGSIRKHISTYKRSLKLDNAKLQGSRLCRGRVLTRLPFIAPRFCELVKRFEFAVTRLRDIITDSVTHKLLREARQTFESLAGLAGKDQTDKSTPMQSMDPTLFDAMVICTSKSEVPQYYPVRSKMDTGADCNLTSMELLKRVGLHNHVEAVEDHQIFQLPGGGKFEPRSKIILHWRNATARKVFVTEFFVSEEEEMFDLLLGLDFISENNVLVKRPNLLGALVKYEPKDKRKLRLAARATDRATALMKIRQEVNGVERSDEPMQGNAALVVPNTASPISGVDIVGGNSHNVSSTETVGARIQEIDEEPGTIAVTSKPDTRAPQGRSPETEHSVTGAFSLDHTFIEPSPSVHTPSGSPTGRVRQATVSSVAATSGGAPSSDSATSASEESSAASQSAGHLARPSQAVSHETLRTDAKRTTKASKMRRLLLPRF